MLKMACSFKNRIMKHRFPAHATIALATVVFLFWTATESYPEQSIDSEIANALRKVVKCERVEIRTKTGDSKSGNLKTLLIRLVGMPKHVLPADFVTVQYANPNIDLLALKKSNFKMKSYSNCKIGMLVSEQTIKNEFDRAAKRLKLHYNKFQFKFTPPYIEVEFDLPASAIPPKDRKLVEKFVRNKRLEGYAALRLEVHDKKISASPVKVVLNHFLLPTAVVSELKKRVNPIYQVPRIRPFAYDLAKIDIMKQHVFLSN